MFVQELRRCLLVTSVAIATFAAIASGAEAAPERDPAATPTEQWKGRFCTKSSCAGAETNPWGQAAGFGAAVVAAGLVARRRE